MKRFVAAVVVLFLANAAQAQQQVHVHTKTCLGGSCRPSAPIQSIPIAPVQRVDLGRLEATTEQIANEQRYQTHLQYLTLAQLQRMADLQLLGMVRQSNGNGATPVPRPQDVQPTPVPLPQDVTPSPVPLPQDVRPTRIPVPIQVDPSVVPGPGFNPGSRVPQPNGGGSMGPSNGPPSGIPLPSSHRSWPQVARS